MSRDPVPPYPSLPYLIDPSVTVHATGRWSYGGAVEISLDDQRPVLVLLPAAEWNVAAMLIDKLGWPRKLNCHWLPLYDVR